MTGWSKTCPPCKRNILKATNIESLPDELIFEILVRVPAQDLYDSTRFVCRKWYSMINTRNFAHSHLQRSTPGLLVLDRYNLYRCKQTLMTMQKGQIETSNLSYGFRGAVLSSCNGLILGINRNPNSKEGPHIIVNPVTKQHFALPQSHSGKLMFRNYYFSLSYAASSGAYKVVSVPCSDHGLVCVIMTVGVDTDFVRRVSTQHLSLKSKELLYGFPLTTPGFVHWAQNGISEHVLSMNVESEIITEIPGPCLRDDGRGIWCRYLPMGSYLSLLIDRGEYLWEVWKMKPETGEWTNMPTIVLESLKVINHLSSKYKTLGSSSPLLNPIGWSNSREVLFLGVRLGSHHGYNGSLFAYNIRTRELDLLYAQDVTLNLCLDHKSSLVWLD